ncbi:Jag family protein [Sinomonas sp.]|jgi:spoIIIJ-associated protein|uniref:Jag family protein n=1 Tax=Sinomonas sp. TaxID=1914986 RepID=UPI002C5F5C66|nr:R3H domain-containing nucleic acid-binding protein [Sinomonas sp.]
MDIEANDSAAEETAGDEESETPLNKLEEEGDVAADYLEELLDIADIDGDIDIEVRGGRTYLSVIGDEEAQGLDALVGEGGEVLEALQELTRLAVLSQTGTRSRLVLDVNGYRKDRSKYLHSLAQDAVEKVKSGGAPIHLAPMSSYERKIVHDAVADLGFVSESEGEGAKRHIVVSTD